MLQIEARAETDLDHPASQARGGFGPASVAGPRSYKPGQPAGAICGRGRAHRVQVARPWARRKAFCSLCISPGRRENQPITSGRANGWPVDAVASSARKAMPTGQSSPASRWLGYSMYPSSSRRFASSASWWQPPGRRRPSALRRSGRCRPGCAKGPGRGQLRVG